MHKTAHFTPEMNLVAAAPENFLATCRGSNEKLIFVGIQLETDEEARLFFLKKILSAVQIDLQKDALFASFGDPDSGSFIQLLRKKGVEKCLLFGLEPARLGLGISVRLNESFVFYGCRFLFAEKLSAIENDVAKKQQLWAALKRWAE